MAERGFMLTPNATSHTAAPSRNAHRISQAEITVSVCLDCGTPIPARLIELTRVDLMIVTDRPLRYGTPVQLALFGDLVSTVTQNRGVVHWCRPHQNGWQLGVFLTMPLPTRLTEREWSDLRSSLRYECNWKAWILWDGDGQLEPVWITNYSVSGVCLNAKRVVAQGDKFTLFGSGGTKDRAALNGNVQWIRKNTEGVLIGCTIHGQGGRELPRMFGNLDAVHFTVEDGESLDKNPDSLETQACELAAREQFLPVPDRSAFV